MKEVLKFYVGTGIDAGVVQLIAPGNTRLDV